MAIMEHCARQGSGLLVVLACQHPMADFAYCRYTWTWEEQEAFSTLKHPPHTISTLPCATPVVLVNAYTKAKAMTSRGPSFSPHEFNRLDQCAIASLLVFDMFGVEGIDIHGPLVAVPSNDVSFSIEERMLYLENLGKDTKKHFYDRAPLLSRQLHTGCIIADYTLSTSGPLIFEDNDGSLLWSEVWDLCNALIGRDEFTHPHGIVRTPATYQTTVQALHQSLADLHATVESESLLLPVNEELNDDQGDGYEHTSNEYM